MQLQLMQILSGTAGSYLTGLRDLEISGTGSTRRLYALAHTGTVFGASALIPDANGHVSLQNEVSFERDRIVLRAGLVGADLPGQPLLVWGSNPVSSTGLTLGPEGQLHRRLAPEGGEAWTRLQGATRAGQEIWGLVPGADRPVPLDPATGLPLAGPLAAALAGSGAAGGGTAGGDWYLLASGRLGNGQVVLISASPGGVLRSDLAMGQALPAPAGLILPEYGTGIATPTALATATVEGQLIALVAGGQSSSLTTFRIATNGAMLPGFHHIDSLQSRFYHAADLAVVQTAPGRAFVVAGGGDLGISLLELLPDGRLLHLSAWAAAGLNQPPGALVSLAADAVQTAGGIRLDVYAAGHSPGIAHLSAGLGWLNAPLQGAVLQGNTGNDRLSAPLSGAADLSGGGGDDILIGAGGNLRLTGGAGRDLFVPGTGAWQEITDFTPGEDRIDLSGWPMLRDPGQLQLSPHPEGLVLSWQDMTLTIRSATKQPLSLRDIGGDPGGDLSGDLLGGLSLWPVTLWQPALPLSATPGDDILVGSGAPDYIAGLAGQDHLEGAEGSDTLQGDDGHDLIYGGGGDDFLWGGTGYDTLYGDPGDDLLRGGPGDDRLRGGPGSDILGGDAGADRLWSGGGGASALWGGDGNDTLYGGDPRDSLYGDAGADQLFADAAAEAWYLAWLGL